MHNQRPDISTVRMLAEREGFADFGYTPVFRLEETERIMLSRIRAGYFGNMHYLHENMDKRMDPGLLLEGARSMMIFLAPYPAIKEYGRYKTASYAHGADYHHVIKEKLRNISASLKAMCPDYTAREFTDSAPVAERTWAALAGLGHIGRNCMLINPRLGNRFLIGCILSNLTLDAANTMRHAEEKHADGRAGNADHTDAEKNIYVDRCGKCRKCLEACPTGALEKPFTIDARKCISYQTIESRLPASEEPFTINRNGWIFGCDECIKACPWYMKHDAEGWKEFTGGYITLTDEHSLMSMGSSAFRRNFNGSPLLRAGIRKIKDNILNAYGHPSESSYTGKKDTDYNQEEQQKP